MNRLLEFKNHLLKLQLQNTPPIWSYTPEKAEYVDDRETRNTFFPFELLNYSFEVAGYSAVNPRFS